MALRVPKNKIPEGKYTAGGEYIVESTNAIYQGYYYELNSLFYAGKSFDINALKLIPIKDRNTLLNRGLSLALFSTISKITSQTLQQPKVISIPNGPTTSRNITSNTDRFYCKKVNEQPFIIKEIDKTTYNSLQSNPLYKTTSVKFVPSPGYAQGIPQNLDQAEKELPGIRIFLLG
jgi:hypothetical protein